MNEENLNETSLSEESKVELKQKVKQDKPKRKIFDGILIKLKKIKHLDVILTVLFIAIILLIYFSTFSYSKPTNDSSTQNKDKNYSASITFEDYSQKLESKLETTLSAIKGAGNVSVILNFDKGVETIIAYITETKTSSDGTITEIKSPVLITNNGKTETVTLQEILPNPCSVVVVATGAANTNVKLEILRAVQAMFNLSTSNIEIFAGN